VPTFNLALIREQSLRSRQVVAVEAETREEAEAIFNDAIIDSDGPVPEEATGDAVSIEIAGQCILIRKPTELVADDWRLEGM
jgi:hypothetical protein